MNSQDCENNHCSHNQINQFFLVIINLWFAILNNFVVISGKLKSFNLSPKNMVDHSNKILLFPPISVIIETQNQQLFKKTNKPFNVSFSSFFIILGVDAFGLRLKAKWFSNLEILAKFFYQLKNRTITFITLYYN